MTFGITPVLHFEVNFHAQQYDDIIAIFILCHLKEKKGKEKIGKKSLVPYWTRCFACIDSLSSHRTDIIITILHMKHEVTCLKLFTSVKIIIWIYVCCNTKALLVSLLSCSFVILHFLLNVDWFFRILRK